MLDLCLAKNTAIFRINWKAIQFSSSGLDRNLCLVTCQAFPTSKDVLGQLFIASFRHSVVLPPTTETAKYSRQQAIEEIHSNFMKTYKETNSKLNDRETTKNEESERRSKAYQKIIGNSQPSYMDEAIAKKQCVR